ncbi:MAG: Gfo/Idh/MocA family oxidoreductase [Planctomycetota bacterium]|nr:Gfo/Idh/MocA family oxidoreductase [Planctomycetota bacterium]
MSQKYRGVLIGVTGIGAGRPSRTSGIPVYDKMGGSHASAYHQHPDTELVAICDLREDALQKTKELWSDVWPDLRVYTDYREMLEKEKPDLVSVATSDHFHADMTVAAAEGGAKGILCEKPIATKLEDADRMIAAAEKNNVPLSIDHTRRWDPSYLKARELIQSGEIGSLRTIVSEMFSQRAMLFRNGTHLIDLIVFFAGSSPEWLFAELEPGFEHFTEYKGDGGKNPATDPYASAYIHFENDVRAFYNSYKLDHAGSKNSLTCDGGRIEITDHNLELITTKSHYEWSTSNVRVENYRATHQLGGLYEIIDVIENGGELISSGREARKTVQIMLGILKSHHAGNVRVNL